MNIGTPSYLQQPQPKVVAFLLACANSLRPGIARAQVTLCFGAREAGSADGQCGHGERHVNALSGFERLREHDHLLDQQVNYDLGVVYVYPGALSTDSRPISLGKRQVVGLSSKGAYESTEGVCCCRCRPRWRVGKDFETAVEYIAVERERRCSPVEEDHHSCNGRPARLDVQLLRPKRAHVFW